MAYIATIVIVLCYGIIIKSFHLGKHNCKLLFVIISAIHIMLFHALRNPYIYSDNTGYDIAYNEISFYTMYDVFIGYNAYTYWEVGYKFFNLILSKFSTDSELLFISSSIIIVGGFMRFVYKWSYIPLLSVLLFLLYPSAFYQSLYVLRQHIATVILLFSLCYIRHFYKSIMLFVLAFLFHYSAIIFLPFYLFIKLDMSKMNLKRILFAGLIVLWLFRLIFQYVINVFPRYSDFDESENNVLPLFVLASLFCMHLLNRSFKLSTSDTDNIILSFLSYGVIISLFVVGLPGGGRMMNYFIYIVPFAYPMLFKYNRKHIGLKLLYSLFFIGLILYVDYLTFFLGNDNNKLEYLFFWE